MARKKKQKSHIAPDLESFATPIDDLHLMEGNPRQGDVNVIEGSLGKFGQRTPIVYRTEPDPDTGEPRKVVYAGNHRLLAATNLGWKEIAAVSGDDLTHDEIRAFSLADNRTGDVGEYDDDLLSALLDDLRDDTELLAATGYDDDALGGLLDDWSVDIGDVGDIDDVPDIPEGETITQLGDVWLLGNHRLVCGDSTMIEPPRDATVMVTDPPYGIGYASNMDGKLKGRGIESDGTTEVAQQAVANWGDKPAVVFWTHKRPFPADVSKSKGCLIWSKGGGGMGDLEFPWVLDWEMAYVFGNGWHRPSGGIRSTAVLSGHHMTNRSNGEESTIDAVRHHPTQKPVSLLADEILSRAPDGDVYEPFAGSGSTLIACEQTGRTCHAIELDPHYCDVICARYQRHTGTVAILESTGEPHDFLEDQ